MPSCAIPAPTSGSKPKPSRSCASARTRPPALSRTCGIFEQITALPTEALAAYAEVLDVLQLTPCNGEPQHEANPEAPVRRWHFAPDLAGQVVYLIVEAAKEVPVLLVQWLG